MMGKATQAVDSQQSQSQTLSVFTVLRAGESKDLASLHVERIAFTFVSEVTDFCIKPRQ